MCRASRDTERTACGHVGKGRGGWLRAGLTYVRPRVRQRAQEGLPDGTGAQCRGLRDHTDGGGGRLRRGHTCACGDPRGWTAEANAIL